MQDFWVKEDAEKPKVRIASPVERPISKTNSICDGRGLGDGHSCSEGFNDAYLNKEEQARSSIPQLNSTFVQEAASAPPVSDEIAYSHLSNDLPAHQSETLL